MANNLILAISFSFKLNSNLKRKIVAKTNQINKPLFNYKAQGNLLSCRKHTVINESPEHYIKLKLWTTTRKYNKLIVVLV